MGLVRNAIESITGTLADQYQGAIDCEDMGNDILMMKKTRPNGIIRNGSIVIVNPGQVAVILDNGKVLDASAEPGAYTWQSDASASFFAGNFGGMFGEMWTRFKFGGGTYQDQAVYYVNTKEIMNNGFGTPSPVMYRDWAYATQNWRSGKLLPMQIDIKCAGNYTFEIDQPWVFLGAVGGTANIYAKNDLTGQMRSEIVASFQEMLNSLGAEEHQVSNGDLLSSKSQGLIRKLMAESEFDAPIRRRGIRLLGFTVQSVTLTEESKQAIRDYQITLDSSQMLDRQHARQIEMGMVAGANEAGAGVGFFNLNMMNQAMPGAAHPQQPAPPQHAQPLPIAAPPAPGATAGAPCAKCGQPVTGKFCSHCGTPAPAPAGRFCSNCGAKVGGKFCAECGTPA